jgi:hypothetical protein
LNFWPIEAKAPCRALIDEWISMARLPHRYAPLVYGIIQAAVTSAVATSVATYQSGASGLTAARYWLGCWSLSWLAMLPIVVLFSPLIQRAVLSLTGPVEDAGETRIR